MLGWAFAAYLIFLWRDFLDDKIEELVVKIVFKRFANVTEFRKQAMLFAAQFIATLITTLVIY
jgi:hypothetical protein